MTDIESEYDWTYHRQLLGECGAHNVTEWCNTMQGLEDGENRVFEVIGIIHNYGYIVFYRTRPKLAEV